MTAGCVKLSSNTTTIPLKKLAANQLKNCVVTRFSTLYQLIIGPSLQSGNTPCRKQINKQLTIYTNQRYTTIPMHIHFTDIKVGPTVALQNTQTKLWDIYGKVVAIGPNQRYHVRTKSGRVFWCKTDAS